MVRPATFVVALLAALAALSTAPSGADEADQPVPTRAVTVVFEPGEEASVPPHVDELAPQTVLVVRALGFEPDTTGTVVQCVGRVEPRCGNRIPVRFDDQGAASFQYLVTETAGSAPGGTPPCRLDGAGCSIEITSGERVMTLDTIFVDAVPPPGRIDVRPEGDLAVGQTITITASGFPPGAELAALMCAEPAAKVSRCGAPGLEVPLTIGPDGTATVDAILESTEVGSEGIICEGEVTCHLAVVSDQAGVRARPEPLSFAAPAGPGYSAPRLVLGLATAIALLLVAAWLIRSTDWRPPREADASAIEEAELADLDLEAALFEAGQPEREVAGR